MGNAFYSSAQAVVLEKTLFGSDRIKRMIESNGTEEILKIFAEVGFGDSIANGTAETEKIIEKEYSALLAFVKSVSPNESFKKLLLYPNDFKNAEALVKAKFLKTEYSDMLSPNGYIDVNVLKDKIFADDYKSLPANMAKALLKSDEVFVNKAATGQFINGLFVKALYDELFSLKLKNKILDKVLKAKVDFINAGVALRSRDFASASNFFVHNGDLSSEDLRFICERTPDEIRERFKFYDIYSVLEKGVAALSEGVGFSAFEIAAESYPVVLMKKYRYSNEGYIPFIRYCYFKLADISNARVISVGKSGGLTKEEISERLREYYEG